MFALFTSHYRRLLIFLSLSTIRASTIMALLLSFVAEFMTLASNLHSRALDRRGAAGGEQRYFEDSDISLQSGGTVGFALAHLLTGKLHSSTSLLSKWSCSLLTSPLPPRRRHLRDASPCADKSLHTASLGLRLQAVQRGLRSAGARREHALDRELRVGEEVSSLHVN